MVFLEWVKDLLDPCFDCHPRERVPRSTAGLHTPRAPGHRVELAASPLAGLGGFAGYHTSVLIAGEEYYFSPCGICCAPRLTSHEASGNVERSFIGVSRLSGVDLLDFLTDHFRPGTYDLLRKNCNSFSDCALYFLCGERLDPRFCKIEQLGRAADDRARLVQVISRGEYLPNERALAFNLEGVLEEIDVAHHCRIDLDSDSCEWLENEVDLYGASSSKERGLSKDVSSGAGYVSDESSSTTGSRGASSAGGLEVEHPWLSDKVSMRPSTSRWAAAATAPSQLPQLQVSPPEGSHCLPKPPTPPPPRSRRRKHRQASPPLA